MAVTLRPMPTDRMPAWIRRSADEYARDLVALGQSEADAQRVADEGMADSFPAGLPNPGHAVLEVLDDAGVPLGYLWIGPADGQDPRTWWVWDVLVEEGRRGRGHGRAAMLLAEDYAASHGAHRLGLSVFGFNVGARRLYESLGYTTTTVRMSKPLRPAQSGPSVS